jgi:cyclase
MLAKRIIACLDIKNGRTVKGTRFLDLRDAGDPVALAERYCTEGVDELVFLDISATEERRKTLAALVSRIAHTINIPFTVGGGISAIEDVDILLNAGADKVSINSAAVRDPSLIDRLASSYGSQCIVVAVDTRKDGSTHRVFIQGGKAPTHRELLPWALEAQDRGAGEILFTSMDRDGLRTGFDLEPTRRLTDRLSIPIIASGGAGSPQHFSDVFREARADAALAAGVFHYGILSISGVKQFLTQSSIPVRL